ncbi:VpaChn25_0724 family phage protein [Profundibacterium mesophilum]|uniref:ArsR family transcriptional regulator n=1 Tax=Profundibacterium mesophilum KAUST100406-0324 TaxID=1037889 RepID=A0A921NNQ5_9RHOB|nr:ArsR family transcriptional regulator [Profundibacterium mesophilum]KAF0674377.1 hypothetical protein PMES_03327 [Profundibacterium mesophilum KAUST100406-0324]
MIWPVERIEAEMRRLHVLRYLAAAGGYEASASVLRLHCARIGLPTTGDQLVADLSWLEQAQLTTLRSYGTDTIARLTSAGRDVAEGTQYHPGVMRPDP